MICVFSVIIPVCGLWNVILFACVMYTAALFYFLFEFLMYFSLVAANGSVVWEVVDVICSLYFISSYRSTLGCDAV